MSDFATATPDVMLVCRNGHVITSSLQANPELSLGHCDRCGSATFNRCLTCGQALPGSPRDLDLVPIGEIRPPHYCSTCGAAFPWTHRSPQATSQDVLEELCKLLRRTPFIVGQFRSRHGDRQPFVVRDDHDLVDMLRALLAVRFDDIRLENCLPSYAAENRTDLLLHPSRILIIARVLQPGESDDRMLAQLTQDALLYQSCDLRKLVYFVYDPERRLVQPKRLEKIWASQVGSGRVVPVIVS